MNAALQGKVWATRVAAFVGCCVLAALIALPVNLERAVESAQITDELGAFPVEVRLAHNGFSTLDTGMFGKVYWEQTGPLGFGVTARSIGPPLAGGTLASYVDRRFVQANVLLIDDPGQTVRAYADAMRAELLRHVLRSEMVAGVLGGALLYWLFWRLSRTRLSRSSRTAVGVSGLCAGLVGSGVLAAAMFQAWPGSAEPETTVSMPGVDRLSFSSAQVRELALQVQPFVAKNRSRIDARAKAYETGAGESFAAALVGRTDLQPREGERIVIAEADTQGSLTGAAVRQRLYRDLVDLVGADSFALRTIAGDVTSNGTVAEAGYVTREAQVSGSIPTAAVGGDHDSLTTLDQLDDAEVVRPDLTTEEVGGLLVTGADDREHKTLFGGMVTNPTGMTEPALGAALRAVVDEDQSDRGDRGRIVLVHQAYAAAGYLGVDSIREVTGLQQTDQERTSPYDDGIADQPPGIIDYGHWHAADGPWVLWNTDQDGVVTWTLVDQLGTAGGVENAPTFSRFSTPTSPPLKTLAVRLQYVDTDSGLATGFASIECDLNAACSVSPRTDVGLPGGQPGTG